ncbi:phosphohexomutase domain-containing protein [Devosia beringensis]|uniref:phosphomannomutase n=1 Tax=Devosia beringensis TaxID=2657486 RepID=UPI00186B7B4A|nr:phosphomannomutase [Devosia beringensis]
MSSLKFGTSGLRGLAVDLVGDAARRYTKAFLDYLLRDGHVTALYLGRDLRASSAAISADCAAAAAAMGLRVIDCGELPAPALARHAMAAGAPSIMVTGSHIPADRNGLKFFRASGEISKADEAGILAQLGDAVDGDYSAKPVDDSAAAAAGYRDRYRGLLAGDTLKDWRIGVFEHSTTGRQALAEMFAGFGAQIVAFGRVANFVAVDTEAFGDAVFAPLPGWIVEHGLDAIISADGDADRPLLMDSQGQFVRGDVLGLLAAQFFGADTVVTPVTSNTAIEATSYFASVVRTRVGSPFVVAGMQAAIAAGGRCVVGFEANGGTLLGSALNLGDAALPALMTRDAILPLIGVFGRAAAENCSIAELVAALPLRVALSDRLENFAAEKSRALLDGLSVPAEAATYFAARGAILRSAAIDGLQVFLDDGTMVHYRASGNAPELRCYVEADTEAQAQDALRWGLATASAATTHG